MALGPVSRKSRELFGLDKPFVKLRPAYSVKLVFSYVIKGIKIKITAKFRASRRLRFEDTKGIMSPEIHRKIFGTFEKQAPGSISRLGVICGFSLLVLVSALRGFPRLIRFSAPHKNLHLIKFVHDPTSTEL